MDIRIWLQHEKQYVHVALVNDLDGSRTISMGSSFWDPQAAAGLVKRFPDQTITLFDATVAALAARLSIPVWTYDHHFDAMQSRVWRR